MSPKPSVIVPLKSSLRVLLVVLLGLASLIPLLIVGGVADERRQYFDQAQHDVADSWGRPQDITGPVLIVPVDYTTLERPEGWSKGWDAEAREGLAERPGIRRVTKRKHVVLLPDELLIDAAVDYEMRERAIYEVALFSADVALKGAFTEPRQRIEAHVASLGGAAGVIDWAGAKLALGVSDPRAIRLSHGATAAVSSSSKATSVSGAAPVLAPVNASGQGVHWGGTAVKFEAGSLDSIMGTSVQVPVTIPSVAENRETPAASRFALQLSLGTTQRLAVNALGGNTRYRLASTWPHPSFNGAHSPVRRELGADGFTANWEVHGIARNLPDIWMHENRPRSLYGQQMGVSFYNPVTTYTIIDRGIKYGLLFIALTFLTFLCFELNGVVKFHVLQYAVVSLGLVMFYMTLLATSEHMNFTVSYVLATALIVGLLGGYTWSMTVKERAQKLVTATITGVLLGLYTTLFVLLQLEDYALLMGTTLLLLGLGALMYATRNLHKQVASADAGIDLGGMEPEAA